METDVTPVISVDILRNGIAFLTVMVITLYKKVLNRKEIDDKLKRTISVVVALGLTWVVQKYFGPEMSYEEIWNFAMSIVGTMVIVQGVGKSANRVRTGKAGMFDVANKWRMPKWKRDNIG